MLYETFTGMDRGIVEAFGWSEIDLAHDFYGNGADIRFTISLDQKRKSTSVAGTYLRWAAKVPTCNGR